MRACIKTGLLLAVLAGEVTGQSIEKLEAGLFSSREVILTQPATSGDEVSILSAANLTGTLTIRTAEVDEITLMFTKRAKTESRSRAFDYIDLISVGLEKTSHGVQIRLRAPNPAPWSSQVEAGMVEAQILMPPGCRVDIDADYFDVDAEGPFQSLVVLPSLGRITVSKVTEELTITAANRRVTIEDITGIIQVKTSNNLLLARHIRSLTDQAWFRNDGGDIKIDDITGSLNVKNSQGRIIIDDLTHRGESSIIRGSIAPIIVSILVMDEGQLVIRNEHEDIDIAVPETISAFMSLKVGEDGVIDASGFPFTTELIQSDQLNLLSGDGRVDIRGTIRGNGNIFIRGVASE